MVLSYNPWLHAFGILLFVAHNGWYFGRAKCHGKYVGISLMAVAIMRSKKAARLVGRRKPGLFA